MGQEQVLYDCTRCRDPYTVEQREKSPFVVIWEDLWIRFLFIVLVLATIVVMVFGTMLFVLTWNNDAILFKLWGIFPVHVSFVCFLLTVVGVGSGFGLIRAIWISHSGRKIMFVSGEPL